MHFLKKSILILRLIENYPILNRTDLIRLIDQMEMPKSEQNNTVQIFEKMNIEKKSNKTYCRSLIIQMLFSELNPFSCLEKLDIISKCSEEEYNNITEIMTFDEMFDLDQNRDLNKFCDKKLHKVKCGVYGSIKIVCTSCNLARKEFLYKNRYLYSNGLLFQALDNAIPELEILTQSFNVNQTDLKDFKTDFSEIMNRFCLTTCTRFYDKHEIKNNDFYRKFAMFIFENEEEEESYAEKIIIVAKSIALGEYLLHFDNPDVDIFLEIIRKICFRMRDGKLYNNLMIRLFSAFLIISTTHGLFEMKSPLLYKFFLKKGIDAYGKDIVSNLIRKIIERQQNFYIKQFIYETCCIFSTFTTYFDDWKSKIHDELNQEFNKISDRKSQVSEIQSKIDKNLVISKTEQDNFENFKKYLEDKLDTSSFAEGARIKPLDSIEQEIKSKIDNDTYLLERERNEIKAYFAYHDSLKTMIEVDQNAANYLEKYIENRKEEFPELEEFVPLSTLIDNHPEIVFNHIEAFLKLETNENLESDINKFIEGEISKFIIGQKSNIKLLINLNKFRKKIENKIVETKKLDKKLLEIYHGKFKPDYLQYINPITITDDRKKSYILEILNLLLEYDESFLGEVLEIIGFINLIAKFDGNLILNLQKLILAAVSKHIKDDDLKSSFLIYRIIKICEDSLSSKEFQTFKNQCKEVLSNHLSNPIFFWMFDSNLKNKREQFKKLEELFKAARIGNANDANFLFIFLQKISINFWKKKNQFLIY